MARIVFNKISCDSVIIPFSAEKEDEAISQIATPNWSTPFTAPFYVKVLKAPYGGNLGDSTMEGIFGWPFYPGNGGIRSMEYLLKTEDNTCYSLSTVRNPGLYIRFRAEGNKNGIRFNPNLVIKTMPNGVYLIEYLSPLTDYLVQFLVWKP